MAAERQRCVSPGSRARAVALLAACALALAGCTNKPRAPIVDKDLGAGSKAPRVAAAGPAPKVTRRPSPVPASGVHVVVRGDTLHAIAWRYGLDYRDLVRWNTLSNPDLIRVGQRLRLRPPPARRTAQSGATSSTGRNDRSKVKRDAKDTRASAQPAPAQPLRWQWPADGKASLARRASGAKGIEIRGKRGQAIKAASSGAVVYSGSGLRGYGELIIIKHSDTYLSAYAHNEKRLVEEGQRVTPGQLIARMGDTEARDVMLHFEIRRNGKTVDPLKYLPRR
ncbi:MAG: peptidoglycan DD-metalloendopeptidase family protein [Gammaproteobacteria bacterium]